MTNYQRLFYQKFGPSRRRHGAVRQQFSLWLFSFADLVKEGQIEGRVAVEDRLSTQNRLQVVPFWFAYGREASSLALSAIEIHSH